MHLVHSLPVLLALTATLPSAQLSGIDATHRDGQTFLTWNELPAADVFYRVYRSTQPIQAAADLDLADELETLDDRSSSNRRRSAVEGTTRHWIIAPGASELSASDGLFVHTSATAGPAWYAVTSIAGGVEDRSVVPGGNATQNPLAEIPAPPQPVLQRTLPNAEVWGHWVGNSDTPFQTAMSTRDSQGFNFNIAFGTAPGKHGLLLRLHAAGQNYGFGFPQRFEVPQDVDILAPDDFFFFTGFAFWFGAHERFPVMPLPGTTFRGYALQRTHWTLEWTQDHLGANHDRGRTFAIGGSMGGIGSFFLASEYPESFAAILARNGNYDFRAPDVGNPQLLQDLCGPYASNLPSNLGLPVYDRADAKITTAIDPGRDWPIVRTINGRADMTSGWMSAVGLFGAMRASKRPAVHYFDERAHVPKGTWAAVEPALLARTFAERSDRPLLAFTDFELDEDPGDGDPANGDVVGTINGRITQDVSSASEHADGAEFAFSLRTGNEPDSTSATESRVRLVPRRLARFRIRPLEMVHYSLWEQGVLKDEHLLTADADGLVETPLAPVTRALREARFERFAPIPTPGELIALKPSPRGPRTGPAPTRSALFVGGAPLPGDTLQYVVFGEPGESWWLGVAAALGSLPTPFGPLLLKQPTVLASGVLDGRGLADLSLLLPNLPSLSGTTVHFQALAGERLSNRVTITLQ